VAVHGRHLAVHEDGPVGLGGGDLNGFAAIAHHVDAVAEQPEVVRRDHLVDLVVFGQQNQATVPRGVMAGRGGLRMLGRLAGGHAQDVQKALVQLRGGQPGGGAGGSSGTVVAVGTRSKQDNISAGNGGLSGDPLGKVDSADAGHVLVDDGRRIRLALLGGVAQDEERRQVAARLDSLTRMAGGVAHDFNNLLNIVMSFGQFVREAVEDTAGAQLTQARAQAILSDVDQIHRASQRAAHLTHQLLTFGGRDTVERAVLDVNVLIGEVLGMISGTIGEHVAITSRLDPHLRHVLASSSQICQVLLNLAVNARDAMPDGGSLHFETANTSGEPAGQAADLPRRDWVRISVTDTGHGMPSATVQQAMEPFFTTKPLGQGTGLGLATSCGIIKQAGGELIIDSLPGRGTTIHLYLPASYQPVDTSGQVASASAGQTILVAEDEDGLRDVIPRMLTGAGYHVLAASNGQEALAMTGRHDDVIHALLTDVVMPAMNGGDVARELRQARPGACVLYMSGYAAPVMTEQGLLDPGVAIVNKPFTRDELLNTLEATLSRQPPREKL